MNDNNRHDTDRENLNILMWNINGIGGKRDYIRKLLTDTKPDVVIISETKMYRPLVLFTDVGST